MVLGKFWSWHPEIWVVNALLAKLQNELSSTLQQDFEPWKRVIQKGPSPFIFGFETVSLIAQPSLELTT